MNNQQKKTVVWFFVSLLPAVLLYIFLQLSAQGYQAYENAKYILIIIVPLVLYIAFKDMFK